MRQPKPFVFYVMPQNKHSLNITLRPVQWIAFEEGRNRDEWSCVEVRVFSPRFKGRKPNGALLHTIPKEFIHMINMKPLQKTWITYSLVDLRPILEAMKEKASA